MTTLRSFRDILTTLRNCSLDAEPTFSYLQMNVVHCWNTLKNMDYKTSQNWACDNTCTSFQQYLTRKLLIHLSLTKLLLVTTHKKKLPPKFSCTLSFISQISISFSMTYAAEKCITNVLQMFFFSFFFPFVSLFSFLSFFKIFSPSFNFFTLFLYILFSR